MMTSQNDSKNHTGLEVVEPWKKELPMWATWLRIALVPIVIALFYLPSTVSGFISGMCFIVASITDYFDGYWARKYKSVSTMGKLLDPIADKLLVSSVLIILIPSGRVEALMVILILSRDTVVGGIRSIAASQNLIIAAGSSGKWKTALQMVAIPCLLFNVPMVGLPIPQIGYWLMWFSVLLGVWSGVEYALLYRKNLKALSHTQI